MQPLAAWCACVLAAALLWTGCAYPPPVPLRFLDLPGSGGNVARAGPLELSGQAGAEWLELTIRNTGDLPVTVDWANSRFVTADGRWHGLVSSDRLAMAVGSGVPTDGTGGGVQPYPGQPVMAGLALPPSGAHEAPPGLEHLGASASLVPPGARYGFVLYPAEHVHLDAFGFWAAPLFCDPLKGGAAGRPFTLALGLVESGTRRTVTFRVRPAGGDPVPR